MSEENNKMIEQNKKKEYILDPLSVIIKLNILSKKNIGSKICIQNNILYIQESNILQPVIRYCYNNNRNDITYLYNPIEIACNHYLNEELLKKNDLTIIFRNAQLGLKKLIETYQDQNLIVHSLNYYYNIIETHLRTKAKKTIFMNDSMSEYYTPELKKIFINMWNNDNIEFIIQMINYIDKDYNYTKNIKCLEDFMFNIDQEIKLLV